MSTITAILVVFLSLAGVGLVATFSMRLFEGWLAVLVVVPVVLVLGLVICRAFGCLEALAAPGVRRKGGM